MTENRREKQQARALAAELNISYTEALRQLRQKMTTKERVALLTGITPEDIDRLGGRC